MLYRDIQASMLRFIADFAEAHGTEANPLTPVNMDAHADESTVPEGDLVCLAALAANVNDKVVGGTLLVGISTQDDTNLMRLSMLIDQLFDSVLPEKRISIYDADSGEVKGWTIVQNGTHVLAVMGEDRPLQYIGLSFLSGLDFNAGS